MRALVMMALVWGVTAAAQTAPAPYTMVVTTQPLAGAAYDTVMASVVEAGTLRAPSTVPMTLRILDDSGAVLATVTGTVSAGAPLRVSARAPSSGGVRAQLILPPGAEQMSAGVLTLERQGREDPPAPKSTFCEITVYAKDPITGMPEPVTILGACTVEPAEG
ncbi:hypothetical protein D7W81_38535 [Corallococcus aberystwythensis]|uniref:Uncharacterized protein n=2 Tax=Corallococcus aberystwythensis TaxID=2316722 RepID=A0A3A8PCI7_9BACT|nr:hypothetical protein D7W81_38535 [Corallococcus aberystwythensis]